MNSLEFGFPPLAGILPADQTNEVVNPCVRHGDHRHGVQLLLSRLHGEVDVDFFGCCGTYMALQEMIE